MLGLYHHPHESAVGVLIKALADEDSPTVGLAGNAPVKIGNPSVLSLFEIMGEAPMERGFACAVSNPYCCNIGRRKGLNQLGLNMVYMKP